jgi:hypothetical protein
MIVVAAIQLPFISGGKNPNPEALLDPLMDAHMAAARRLDNASTNAVINACAGSGDLGKGIAAALLTTGYRHAPLEQARRVYEEGIELPARFPIPGFGNSFFKDSIDPAFSTLSELLEEEYPSIAARIELLTKQVRELTGKNLFPNAALFTAAVCSEIGVPRGAEIAIFILARMPVWVDLVTNTPTSERRAASADDGTQNQGVSNAG